MITIFIVGGYLKTTLACAEKQYLNLGIYFSRTQINWIYISMDRLNEQEIAQYVDALMLDEQGQLPKYILEHVEECAECKIGITEVLELTCKQEINPKPV